MRNIKPMEDCGISTEKVPLKEDISMTEEQEDGDIMIDFEAVKNPLKKELKKEDKFVDLKSWADAFNKQKMVETIEEVNKGAFHGFDATDIPKSKINVYLNSVNLIRVDSETLFQGRNKRRQKTLC